MTQVALRDRLSGVIGGKTATAFAEGLGIETVGDLLRHYPRRYIDPGDLTDLDMLAVGEHATVLAEVVAVTSRHMKQRKGTVTEVVLSDGRGRISAVFFNQKWREGSLREGRRGLFAGTVSAYGRTRQLAHPKFVLLPADAEDSADAEAQSAFADLLIPIYPATAGLPSWRIQQAVRLALDAVGDIEDPLPAEVRLGLDLLDLGQALGYVHRPPNRGDADRAIDRLRFEEAFTLQVVLAQRRHRLRGLPAMPRPRTDDGLLARFEERLPFALTPAQRRVGEEIGLDLAGEHPMHRLLQGDVGSGKTVVALRAMLQAVDAGGQAVLLAPTEVLAQQHHRTLTAMLGPLADAGFLGGDSAGTRVGLLVGSLPAARRRQEMLDIASGTAGIVVGTHALLEEKVSFADLALVVIDEQHRFGVEQRAALATRTRDDSRPHTLVMTATPIPRTVAMTVFGDLDVSVLDAAPPGRGRIDTHVVIPRERPAHLARAWQRAREEVAAGRKVYVVCPRIGDDSGTATLLSDDEIDGQAVDSDDSTAAQMSSVLDVAAELRERILPELRIGHLHGRMPSEDKDEAMRRFASDPADPQAYDVLVSTTVVEVGVDVPIASMMIVLDADRFGISQLHQLRGRIGRGGDDAICLLVTDAEAESPARERLQAVAATTDGFALARSDLQARREGDVLGTSQSGRRRSLRLLEVIRDQDVVEQARDAAVRTVEAEPDLRSWPALREAISELVSDDRTEFLEKG